MIIERRYNGPPGSGNGGWSAGTVAAHLDSPAGIMVTLRIPPPLDTPLSVEYVDSGVAVYTPRGIRVADAEPSVVQPAQIEPVPYQQAVEVSAGYPGFTAHPFPTCFVCGPQREPGDGLRLFPGRLADGRTATPWTVPDDVSPAMVWACLDCPGGWSVGIEARPYVLGRICARLDAVPRPGEQCVVMGRLTGAEGRKASVATTLYGHDGRPIAYATAIWVAID